MKNLIKQYLMSQKTKSEKSLKISSRELIFRSTRNSIDIFNISKRELKLIVKSLAHENSQSNSVFTKNTLIKYINYLNKIQ